MKTKISGRRPIGILNQGSAQRIERRWKQMHRERWVKDRIKWILGALLLAFPFLAAWWLI